MRSLGQFVEGTHRCLYVAKGPTAIHATEHLDFGHVATVNYAAILFSHVDWSFWCDVPPFDELTAVRDRCRTFVLPDILHNGKFNHLLRQRPRIATAQTDCFPEGRTLIYPYNFIRHRPKHIKSAINADKVPMSMTAPAGLFILARYLGYREIWCFGHDGGRGYAPGIQKQKRGHTISYDVFRRAVETVADCVHQRYGTVVRFWSEEHPSFVS